MSARKNKSTPKEFLQKLGIEGSNHGTWTGLDSSSKGSSFTSYTPIDSSPIAEVTWTTDQEYEQVIDKAQKAFKTWKMIPAPERGDIIRQIGDQLRENKEELGSLVSYENGKIYQEGLGEVQEMIDICDFALGQSRMMYGNTMHSERPRHRFYDQWHPYGLMGLITAFNFPVAVWSWNTMVAAVCGNVTIWKPSDKTPLTALACQKLVNRVLKENDVPEGVFNLVMGGRDLGTKMADDRRLPLISATGSIPMGRDVGQRVAARLGRSILELGGNNPLIISDKADLEMAIRATVFGAVGTAGQRCTTTRRLIVHDKVFDEVKDRLVKIYRNISIGNPLDENNLVGPLIDTSAVQNMKKALEQVKQEGGEVIYGGEVLDGPGYENGQYVTPAICTAENEYQIVQEETFAPILYMIRYRTFDEAIEKHNGVRQGLSSALFTLDLREAEQYLSHIGSDTGISNINAGTSGAEIGGAFGGEKETGGGRECGSDAWKNFMRRQTNAINWSTEMPLAQGISFDV